MSGQMSVLNNDFARRGGGYQKNPLLYLSLRPRKWGPQKGSNAMDQLLRIGDLQTRLSVSRSTAYRFIRANKIPIVYVLGAPRIRATDVEKALFTKKAV